MTFIAFLSSLIFCLLKKDLLVITRDNKDKSEANNSPDEYQSTEEEVIEDEEKGHQRKELRKRQGFIWLMKKDEMQRLIPLCIWSGVSIAYYSGYMVTLIGEKSGTHYAESY